VAAITNTAHYAVELDPETTAAYRQYLAALAAEVNEAEPAALRESRSTLRGLLRDYRDRASHHLADLRQQLESTVRALEETVETLSQPEGDDLARIRAVAGRLRNCANSSEARASTAVCAVVEGAADATEQSLGRIRRQHQFAITQLRAEIRLLHGRVESLENAVAVDEATRFSSRRSIEEYLQSLNSDQCRLLILKLRGLAQARAKYGAAIVNDLVAAFACRLHNSVPKEAVVGRWSEQDFLAVLPAGHADEGAQGHTLTEHLSMPYACLLNGKTVRISLSVSVQPLAADASEPLIERLRAAFDAP
jgi:GGDEF domain-containing protein